MSFENNLDNLNGSSADWHIDVDSIPTAMKQLDQWVVWKLEARGKQNSKPTKIPYNGEAIKNNSFRLPHIGDRAKSNEPGTWTTFEIALEAMQSCPELSGIGFCFSKEDGLAGIDLDHCFDSGGALLDWASEILDQFHQSYIELSPSGDGLHIWCYGKAVRAGRRIVLSKERGVEEAIEIYDSTSNRYFTVTGKPFRRLQK